MTGAEQVDAYLAEFPDAVRERLAAVRAVLLAAMPGGEEKVRYGMPAVMIDGRYGLHYAGWKKHIGLYPVPRFEGVLEAEVAPLRTAKDSVSLPHDRELPLDLIERIARAI